VPRGSGGSSDLEQVMQHLRDMPLADYFEEVNAEHMHKDPADIDAAWAEQFGEYAEDFGAAVSK